MPVVLLFFCWLLAELLVAIGVAEAIGVLDTVLLLIVGWPIGILAVRSRGRVARRRLASAVAAGRAPGREVIDGALVLLGGALLILPGFISDAVGIFVLIPPSRAPLRGALLRNLERRSVKWAVRFAGGAGSARGPGPGDVDSTATDVDSTAADVDSTAADVDSAAGTGSSPTGANHPRLRR
ncbi:MAG: FxsA family protein [Solirubrobacteraceae bacterium]